MCMYRYAHTYIYIYVCVPILATHGPSDHHVSSIQHLQPTSCTRVSPPPYPQAVYAYDELVRLSRFEATRTLVSRRDQPPCHSPPPCAEASVDVAMLITRLLTKLLLLTISEALDTCSPPPLPVVRSVTVLRLNTQDSTVTVPNRVDTKAPPPRANPLTLCMDIEPRGVFGQPQIRCTCMTPHSGHNTQAYACPGNCRFVYSSSGLPSLCPH
jgi:hypothetical protein